MLITVESSFFNIITYLLLNSDYGIGCVYSPHGLVIFVAVEGTFVCFTVGSRSLYFKYYRLVLLLCQTETSHDRNSDIQNGNTR